MRQDDLVALLNDEADFKEAKPALQEAIERKGGEVIFGVKFHPELMEIESCYRYDLKPDLSSKYALQTFDFYGVIAQLNLVCFYLT